VPRMCDIRGVCIRLFSFRHGGGWAQKSSTTVYSGQTGAAEVAQHATLSFSSRCRIRHATPCVHSSPLSRTLCMCMCVCVCDENRYAGKAGSWIVLNEYCGEFGRRAGVERSKVLIVAFFFLVASLPRKVRVISMKHQMAMNDYPALLIFSPVTSSELRSS
jgi:hypothetical protein